MGAQLRFHLVTAVWACNRLRLRDALFLWLNGSLEWPVYSNTGPCAMDMKEATATAASSVSRRSYVLC
jgi:hypothetical protein